MSELANQNGDVSPMLPLLKTPKGLYRHYKGMLYEVIDTVRHSETLEAMTLYRALYGDFGLWVRPAAMFSETVVIDGVEQKRFTALAARPELHFTPPCGWMNDPNGLVFYAGEYHLFYQCYSGGYAIGERYNDPLKWGPMHWGHAVSRDLIHWVHLPIAIAPLERLQNGEVVGMAFSGCAVIDWANTAGFNRGDEPAMIALYTQCDTVPMGNQRQGLAYSLDHGRTWQQYSGNPVLPNPNKVDFRDPKVFWYEPSKSWVMLLAAKDQILFYRSPDLKNWDYLSSFGCRNGIGQGARGEPWECPDLFELPIESTAGFNVLKSRWILLVSVAKNAANGGSGTQYFIGHFDGTIFVNDLASDATLWLDYGRDYYAAVSWEAHPKNATERIVLGWMSNWDYAQDVPAVDYRSAMAIARQLTLVQTKTSLQLRVLPVEQLGEKLEPHAEVELRNKSITVVQLNQIMSKIRLSAYEIRIRFEATKQLHVGFKICKNDSYETIVGFDGTLRKVYIDRTKSSLFQFSGDTGVAHSAPLRPVDRCISLRLIVDLTSVEVFANDGNVCLTDLHLAPHNANGLAFFANTENVKIKVLRITAVKS
jgi:fructan beta-fructosidase